LRVSRRIGRGPHGSGESRRENAEAHLEFNVVASEAKQSILPLRGNIDCFASLAMTASRCATLPAVIVRQADVA
jgi:hypothetical protein